MRITSNGASASPGRWADLAIRRTVPRVSKQAPVQSVRLQRDYSGTSALATRVPFPKWARIYGFSSGANANYNALILSAEKRLSHGLTFKTAYTYSKALTRLGVSPLGNKRRRSEPLDLKPEGGPTADNVPHRFVGTFSWELPFGRAVRSARE